ncbi:glycosyltransferase [Frankia sp. R43]|uniref:glycosyltransferase n=1 Tax=Frankia sp. R43 TaxID=269536 RepID=UPI001F4142BC|nr:glycosyltransferase [Frankia sp. R43]
MTPRLRVALAALDILAAPPERLEITLLVTSRAGALEDPLLAGHPRIGLVGELPVEGVSDLMLRCDAIYFPTQIESFGYPLAEARMMGIPVVARRSAHNLEIAGNALMGYDRETPEDIADAFYAALTAQIYPDRTRQFDRDTYFDRLLGAAKS